MPAAIIIAIIVLIVLKLSEGSEAQLRIRELEKKNEHMEVTKS